MFFLTLQRYGDIKDMSNITGSRKKYPRFTAKALLELTKSNLNVHYEYQYYERYI